MEYNLTDHSATIWDDGNKSFTFTNEKQLGQAVVAVLKHPEDTKNKYLYIASVETTQNKILAALEESSGRRWTVTKTTTETQVAEALKKLAAGDFSGAFALVRGTVFGNIPGLRSDYIKEEKIANDILGLEMEEVNDVVERVLNV